MTHPLAYLHGRFLPASEAALPLHDAGFVLGATVTDQCRTVRHRLYRWDDHLARFLQGCRLAHLQPPPAAEIARIAEELVAHNAALLPPQGELALVLFLTPGLIGYYAGEPGAAGDEPPTFGMHTFPIRFERYCRLFRAGASLAISTVRQVSAASVDPHLKQRSRIHWWLADREVQARFPGAMALLLDEHGHLTETAAANVLLVRGGTILSPPLATVLEGVSLRFVRELCGDLALPFEERPLTLADAGAAEEILLTSTPYFLAGVSRLDKHAVPWPGPIYQQLLGAWGQRIGLDIRGQIDS